MKTRILTAAVMLAVFLPVLWFSDLIVYPIVMALLAAIGIWELLACLGISRDYAVSLPAAAVSAAMPILAYFAKDPLTHLGAVTVAAFLLALYLFGTAVFRVGKRTFGQLMGALGGTFYLSVAFSSLVLLRGLAGGEYLFLLPFIGSWVTDTFAYFTGRFFGRHKLAPVISPKKTVEGSVGGILFAILSFVLFGLIVAGKGLTPSYLALVLCGLAVSVVSQIGDLALSAIKREYGIKDYSHLFPGHGGVLDRFDSVIATAPLILFFCLVGGALSLFL